LKEKLKEKHDTWFKKRESRSLEELRADNSDFLLDVYTTNLKRRKDEEISKWYGNQMQLDMLMMTSLMNNLVGSSVYISRLEQELEKYKSKKVKKAASAKTRKKKTEQYIKSYRH